jgi:hypothetical protein
LLENGSKSTSFCRQRLCEHVPAATDTLATIEVPSETVFSIQSVERVYREDNWDNQDNSVREFVKKRDRRRDSWKGAAVQRGLEHGCRGMASVKSRYQSTTSEDTAG